MSTAPGARSLHLYNDTTAITTNSIINNSVKRTLLGCIQPSSDLTPNLTHMYPPSSISLVSVALFLCIVCERVGFKSIYPMGVIAVRLLVFLTEWTVGYAIKFSYQLSTRIKTVVIILVVIYRQNRYTGASPLVNTGSHTCVHFKR
jgi:hypothetical protein